MIKSMIFLVFIVIAVAFVVIAKKYSSRLGKSIQDTTKEILIEEREKKENEQ